MGEVIREIERLHRLATAEARRIDAVTGFSRDPLGASEEAEAAHAAAWAVVDSIDVDGLTGRARFALQTALSAGALSPSGGENCDCGECGECRRSVAQGALDSAAEWVDEAAIKFGRARSELEAARAHHAAALERLAEVGP